MSELQTIVQVFDPDEKPRFNGHALARRTAVPLERLPEGLEFPDGLRDHISYDAERRLLVFRGFMSSADYYFLRTCSADPEYIQATLAWLVNGSRPDNTEVTRFPLG